MPSKPEVKTTSAVQLPTQSPVGVNSELSKSAVPSKLAKLTLLPVMPIFPDDTPGPEILLNCASNVLSPNFMSMLIKEIKTPDPLKLPLNDAWSVLMLRSCSNENGPPTPSLASSVKSSAAPLAEAMTCVANAAPVAFGNGLTRQRVCFVCVGSTAGR